MISLNYGRPNFHKAEKPDAQIILDSEGVWIQTGFDEGWIEAFKAFVPWSDRNWIPAKTSWFVTFGYAENVIGLTKLFFEDVEVKDLRNE